MTSLRKIKDATKIACRPRRSGPRRSPVSRYAEEILECLDLKPPEGLHIAVPEGVNVDKFRRNISAMVYRNVRPFSTYRFRITVAFDGSILVACKP